MKQIKVGCCGWPISLKKYREIFPVVEIQKTFYKLPKLETASKWREQAGEGFEFVVKAPQLITHPPKSPTYRKAGLKIPEEKKDKYGFFKPTTEVFEVFEETLKFARTLKSRLILFQTPASFSEAEENVENLKKFFSEIQRDELILMWEPRGNWREETLLSIFKGLNLVHVVDPFKKKPLYGEILYFRLHGRAKGYRYEYSEDELKELLDIVQVFGSDKKETYIMFNNTNMLQDAQKLLQILKEQKGK